jgi:hypothetical protein
MELLNEVLMLCTGKECAEDIAAAALVALRQALAERLGQLLGNLDALMNDAAKLAGFCKLHWSVLEVSAPKGSLSLCLAPQLGLSLIFLPQTCQQHLDVPCGCGALLVQDLFALEALDVKCEETGGLSWIGRRSRAACAGCLCLILTGS